MSGRDLPERGGVYDRLVRSHLRAGNADAAQEAFAGTSRASVWLPPSLGAAVRAARGETDRVETALIDSREQQGGLAAFYADEDFAREIAAPKFAELRKKYPDPRKK